MKKNAQKEAYWRSIVKRQAGSGASVRRFCADQDISEASFYWWRKRLTERSQRRDVPSDPRPSEAESLDTANGHEFIPLAVADSAPTLEIIHPLGYRVRITGEVNAQLLKQVLDAIEERGEA